jgi:hypothetical protein
MPEDIGGGARHREIGYWHDPCNGDGLMPIEPEIHDGACHAKIKTDRARWRSLPLVGIQRYVGAQQDVLVELRNCTCGSTLGRRVGRSR